MAVLARLAEQCMFNFNSQNLANMAWAFAAVDQLDVVMFAALARVA